MVIKFSHLKIKLILNKTGVRSAPLWDSEKNMFVGQLKHVTI